MRNIKTDWKIFLLFLMVIFIFSISYVSAEDNMTLSDSSEILQDGNDEILHQTQENALNDNEASFNELSTLIGEGGSSIKLNKNYTMQDGESHISISKNNLIIDGQGHTLNANYKGNVFVVSGTNITFKNITFINGLAGNGGAIGDFYGSGKYYTVIDCTFINNTAENCGGAVYSNYNPIYIYNSTFINNRNNGNYGGGAIFSDTDIYVDGCRFYGNTIAKSSGSAIRSNKGLVSLSNSVFAQTQMGYECVQAARYEESDTYLTFSDLSNLISNSNGVVNLQHDYKYLPEFDNGGITISKTITVNGNGHTIDADGNALCIFKITGNNVVLKNINITNGYIYENNNVGVAVSWSGSNGLLDNVVIANSTFDSVRNAGGYNWWNSGMIYWNGVNGVVNNVKFISDKVVSSKGIIIWLGLNGTVNNSYFYDCSNAFNGYVGYLEAASFFIYWNADNGKFLNSKVDGLKLSTRDVPNPCYVSFVKPGYVGNVTFTNCQHSNHGQTVIDLNMPFSPVEDYVWDFTGTLAKQTPTISVPTIVVSPSLLNISVNSVRSGSVTYRIDNGASRTLSVDNNGCVGIDISYLTDGSHKITYSYTGNSYYNDVATQTADFTYKIFSPKLTFTNITSSNGKYSYNFTVNLVDGNGNYKTDIPATFDIVSYDGKKVTVVGVSNSTITWEGSSPLVNLTAFVDDYEVIPDYYPLKSLQMIINAAASGNTIVLYHNYTWTSSIDTYNAGAYVFSFNNRIIDGNGYAIDGLSKITLNENYQPSGSNTHDWKLFNLGNNAVLKNINIVNYTYHRYGYISGGAVYVSGSNVKLINVNMTGVGNLLYAYTSLNAYGGAVIWNGNDGLIDNCNFINCHGGQLGTITILRDNVVMNNCLIENSTIYNWHTGSLGATAIRWDGNNGVLTNSVIKNSKKDSRGANENYQGTVSFTKKPKLIENLTMSGNLDDYDLQAPFAPVEDYIGNNIQLQTGFKKISPTSITLENNIISVNPVRSGSVTYTVDGGITKTSQLNENGQFTVDYDFNPSQNYVVKVIYNENDYYTSLIQYFDYGGEDAESFGSFTDLNNLIISSSGSIINLNKNYVYDPVKDLALSQGIVISKVITINGNNHYIDADYNAVRIFTTKAHVVLNNITFKNSRLEKSGNAVLANAPIDINYCTFDNNWAYGQFGGAVNLAGGNSNVKYCTFTNNKAQTGAAIVVNSNDNYILHSYFKDNAKNYGGNMNYGSDISVSGGKSAYVNYNVFLDYRPLRQISAEYSRDNWYGINALPDSSSAGAPSISNYLKASLDYEIKNNLLTARIVFTESDTGNVVNVQWADKVIYTIGATSLISDTLTSIQYSGVSSNVVINAVVDNQRLTNQNSKAWYVKTTGSDYNSGTESSPYKTLNKALQSASNGDVIYVAPGTYQGSNNVGLSISKSVTIERWGSSGEVIFDGQSNKLIFTLNSNVILSSLTFKNGKNSNGGALVIKSDSVIIDCSFIDNVASSWGGAIDMNPGSATIINSRFINNYAPSGGGAISTAGVNLVIFNSTFENNFGGRGGAINSGNVAANLNVVGSTFRNNSANSYGGALLFDGKGNITDSLFEDNSASLGGGAVYFWDYTHMISDCVFTNNSATDGGAVISLCANITLFNSHFNDNKAYGFGGAVYGAFGDLLIFKNDFSNGVAYYDGGAVYTYKSEGAVYESLFKRNVAGYGGGAVHLLASDVLCARLGMIDNITSYLNGYVNTMYAQSFIDFGNYTMVVANTSNYDGVLPSYFSLVDNGWDTPVKNQGSLGICWDYAVIATVETAIKKATGVEVDLSENNVKNLISLYSIYGNGRHSNSGGYVWDALSYMANSLGPVYESLDKTDSFEFSPLLSNVYHISNIAFATRSRNNPLDNDEVKEAIIKYGAVRVSINMDDAHKGYNYYHSTNVGTNHAIALVGWDDNYSKDNFPDGCPGDGAWIVKNSWGPGSGKNGYIYVSYYDQTFAWDGLAYIIFNDTIHYNRVYQYDYSRYGMKSSGNTSSWYKNIYTSVKNEGLSAFSTYFNEKTDWEVFVYVGDELKHTQNGNSISGGYFTFNFDKIIPVAAGEQFTIELKVNKGNLPIVSKDLNTLTCGAGVSFYSNNGINWNDLDNDNQVACLKVFTQNMPGSLVSILPIENVTYGLDVAVNFNVENRTVVNYIVKTKDGRIVADISNFTGNRIVLTNLASGNYSIIIVNQNSEKYVGNQKTADFTVNKANSLISINSIENKTYGNTFTIGFSISNETSLNYTLKTKDGKIITTASLKNVKSIVAPVLDVGDYIITICNRENENYTGDVKSQQFSITKADSSIIINEFDYNWNAGVADVDFTGALNVTAFVVGHSEAAVTVNGKKIHISNLSVGSYTLNVTTVVDKNHNIVSKTVKFTVKAVASQLSDILNISFIYGLSGETPISYSGASGVNAVIIGHNEAKIEIKSNKIIISNLNVGTYTLNVSTIPDNNHTSVFKTATVNVNRANPELTITVTNITYPGSVGITLNSKVDGSYTVKVNGTDCKINVVGGVGEGSILKSAGIYNASVSLTETANYNASSAYCIFEVYQNTTYNFSVYPNEITGNYGGAIEVTSASNADFNGKVVYSDLASGKVLGEANVNSKFSLPKLDAGEYQINASFAGNVNYASKWVIFKLTVKPIIDEMTVTSSNYTYGDKTIVKASVNYSDASGKVVYYIDGKIIGQSDINGEGFVLTGLKAGQYLIKAIYTDDINYQFKNTTFKLNVKKASSTVSSADLKVIYPNPVIIDFNAQNATSISYTLFKDNIEIRNGKIQLNDNIVLNTLTVGEYIITLKTEVDENHTSTTAQCKISVENGTIDLTVDGGDIVYPNKLTVKVKSNVTGKYQISIPEANINDEIDLTANVLKEIYYQLNSGNYTVKVTGNIANYNVKSAEDNVKVSRADSELNIHVSDSTYPDNVTVTVKSKVDGEYAVDINGTIYKVSVVGGVGLTSIGKSAGIYNASVSLARTANYNASSAYCIFEIYQNTTYNFSVYPNEITGNYGGAIEVTSATNADFNGKVVFTNLASGKVLGEANVNSKFTFPKLDAGEYQINASFAGNVNYASKWVIFKLTVKPIIDEMTVTSSNYTYGDKTIIKSNVNYSDASGKVVYYIDGKIIGQSDINGEGFVLTGLKAGQYLIKAIYTDDINYQFKNTTFKLNVKKASSTVSSSDLKVIYPNPVIIDFNAQNATGISYILYNEGVEIKKGDVLLTGDIVLNTLTVGEYIITLKTEVDENHTSTTAQSKISVENGTIDLTVDGGDVVYPDNLTVKVKSNVTGEFIISILKADINMKVNLTAGKEELFNFGVLNVGEYNVSVVSSIENYNIKSSYKIINVFDGDVDLDVKVDSITYNGNAPVAVVVVSVEGDYRVVINGKYDKVKSLTKGINLIDDIPVLDVGVYNLTVSSLIPNYDSVTDYAEFSVNMGLIELDVEVKDVVYPNKLTVKVKTDVDGRYLINIPEANINDEIDLTADVLKEIEYELNSGDYTVIVSGNILNYKEKSVVRLVQVFKADSELNIHVSDSTYPDNVTVTVKSKVDGEYSVDINGTIYKVSVDGGVGITSIKKSAGIYNASISLTETANYNASNTYHIFRVYQNNTYNFNVYPNEITGNYGEAIEITSVCDADFNGNVIFTDLSSGIVLGEAGINSKFILPKLSAGEYQINASFAGNVNYASKWSVLNLKINPIADGMTVTSSNYTYGASTTIKATVNYNDASGKVVYYIGDEVIGQSTINDDGFVLTGLKAGEYTIKAVYTDDINYHLTNNTFKLNVKKASSAVSSADLKVTYPNPVIIEFNAQNATGISYALYKDNSEIRNGEVQLNENIIFDVLDVGEYVISIKTIVDENHSSATEQYKITVSNGTFNLTMDVFDTVYPNKLAVKVKTDVGGRYLINIPEANINDEIDLTADVLKEIEYEFDSGDYTVIVSGNILNYKEQSIVRNVQLFRADSELNIHVSDSTYPDNVTVTVKSKVDGEYVVDINGTIYKVNVVGGSGITSIKKSAGIYNASVSLAQTANYNASSAYQLFKISQNTTYNFNVYSNEITGNYGEAIEITSVCDADFNGNVVFTDLSSGKVLGEAGINSKFILPKLSAGEYQINASCAGNGDYASKWAVLNLKINPIADVMTVTLSNYTYGDKTIVKASVNYNDASGKVVYYIGDEVIGQSDINGEGFVLTGLKAGDYTIKAVYTDDINYKFTNNTFRLNVKKASSTVSSADLKVTYPNPVIIDFNAQNATGISYIVYKDGVEIKKGDVLLTEDIVLNSLNVGEYIITLKTEVDENHSSTAEQYKINILNGTIALTLDADDIVYPDNLTVKVKSNVTGEYIIRISQADINMKVNLTAGKEELFNFEALNVGEYNITVVSNIDNYKTESSHKIINIFDGNVDLDVKVDSIIYAADKAPKAHIFVNVDGNYRIVINGKYDKVKSLTSGINLIEDIPLLDVGVYNLTVTSLIDNYETVSDWDEFSVGEGLIELDVEACDVVYPNKLSLKVKSNVGGKYIITIPEANINEEVVLTANVLKEIEYELGSGNYTVKVTGNIANYNVKSAEDNVKVYRADPELNINVNGSTYPDNVTVTVKSKVDGEYSVDINGTIYGVSVVGGVGITSIKKSAGIYNASVSLAEAANYNASKAYQLFKISQNTTYNFNVYSNQTICIYGEAIEITSICDADINGKVIFTDIASGKILGEAGINSKFTLPKLDVGEYQINASFEGNENYALKWNVTNVVVLCAESYLSSQDYEFVYGSPVSISVESQNATEILYNLYDSNGNKLVNGTIGINENIRLTNMDVGNYTINLTTLTDKNHNAYSASYSLKISNATVGLELITYDATYPKSSVIEIKTNVTGNYIIKIANITREIRLEANNQTRIILDTLPADVYEITVMSNVSNYNTASVKKTITVSKAQVNITVDVKSIKINQNATVSINITGNATGNVSITLDNVTRILFIKDPQRTVTFENLSEGSHTVTVRYNGDLNHHVSTVQKSFNVSKYSAKDLQNDIDNAISRNEALNLTHDYTFAENDTVIINHALTINGNGYTIDANGFSNIFNITSDNVVLNNLTLCDAQNSAINWFGNNGTLINSKLSNNSAINGGAIKWMGNDANIINSQFINNTASNQGGAIFITGDNPYIENTLFTDNEAAVGAGISFTNEKMIVSKSKFDKNNASNRVSGIAVGYDSNVEIDYQTKKDSDVTIDLKQTQLTVSSINTIGNSVAVIVNVVSNTHNVNSGNVSVIIGSKKYTSRVVDGEAVINIIGLSSGRYDEISLVYEGSPYYYSNALKISFEISQSVMKITENKNINAYYLEPTKYAVCIMDSDNNPVYGVDVKFKLNGHEYNVKTDKNGYSILNVNLAPGTYGITAEIQGYLVYNVIEIKHIINAKKISNVKKSAKKTTIKITVKGHKAKQSMKVKFTYKGKSKVKVKFSKLLKKQNVLVKFKGKTYKVKVNKKGVGTLKLKKKVVRKLKKGKKYSTKVTYTAPKLYKKVKLTIKFAGKKYKIKTDKKGVAKFKVTKKMVKKFKKSKKVKYTITYKKDIVTRFVKIK